MASGGKQDGESAAKLVTDVAERLQALLLVDGKVVAQGSYPAREVLAELAGISPFAWIVNQSLTQVTTRDPVLRARRAAERPYLEEVAAIARRLAVVAWEPATPRGAEHLSVPER